MTEISEFLSRHDSIKEKMKEVWLQIKKDQWRFRAYTFFHDQIKTSVTALTQTVSHVGQQRAQRRAVNVKLCPRVDSLHLQTDQASISSCQPRVTLQHPSSLNSLCLWNCPLLYRAAIRGERQKGREAGSKTVSAQWITFRPSHGRLGDDPCQAMT